MGKVTELNWLPISDSTLEVHFGSTSTNCKWIEFEKNDFSIWRGSFMNGEYGINMVLPLNNNDDFFVVASGNGYWVDNQLSTLKFELTLDNIILVSKISEWELLIANWSGFYILEGKGQLLKIDDTSDISLIEVEMDNERVVRGKLEASEYQWELVSFEFEKRTKRLTIKE